MKTCTKCNKVLSSSNFHKENSTSDGLHRWCKQCSKEYRLENKSRENARHKKWYWENHEKRLKQNKQSYWRNREIIRLQRKQWSLKNKELVSKKWRDWSKENKDYLKAKKAERKARILNNGGSFTKQEWSQLKGFYHFTCLVCKRKEPEVELTPDHVIPLVKGGTSNIDNIQPLCRSCNCSKRDQIIDYRKEVNNDITRSSYYSDTPY